MLLENKISIVTGGATGIGKSIASMFAKEGSDVAISDINIERAKITALEIEKNTGRKTMAIKVNVSKKNDVEEMVKEVINKFGKIDILVNNAGVQKRTPFLEFTEELWDWIIGINLKGTFLCSQAVAKEMVKKKIWKDNKYILMFWNTSKSWRNCLRAFKGWYIGSN